MKKLQLAMEFCRKHPEMPTRGLSKMLYDQFPKHFKNSEDARHKVRKCRGEAGAMMRQKFQKKIAEIKSLPPKRVPIPHGVSELGAWEPYRIDGPATVLVLSDIHVPFHEAAVVEIALEHAAKHFDTTHVLFNGDFIDCYAESYFENNPDLRDFPGELNTSRQMIAAIRSYFPTQKFIYKNGNHEERHEKYIWAKAEELYGVSEINLDSLMKFKEFEIDLVPLKRPVHAGKLSILHGHEYSAMYSNQVNAARWIFMRGKSLAMCGHFHQTSQHSENTLDGKVISTWSVGCMCNLHPRYRPLNNWNHGFAVVQVDQDGAFTAHNFRIMHGKVW